MQKFQFSRPPVSSQQKNHRKSSVTEKILQKKISCTCLDCSEIVLWEPSGQNHSILPAQVASHSLDSGSTWGAWRQQQNLFIPQRKTLDTLVT